MDLQRLKGLTNRAIDAKKDADKMSRVNKEDSVYAHIDHMPILLTYAEVNIIINRYVAEKREKYKKSMREIDLMKGE